MINYIKDFLPRLQNFNKSLDDTSVFINKPWIFLDPLGNQVQYIFQRSGQLVISKEGKAHLGTWEYLAASKSLLINRGNDLVLLNQIFIEDAVLFLKPDGTNNEPWILVNKNIIPDLNYKRYLSGILGTTTKFKKVRSDSNDYYYTDPSNSGGMSIGSDIYDSNLNLLVQAKQIRIQGVLFSLSNGKIIQFLYPNSYMTNKGAVIVNQTNPNNISIGDTIIQDDKPTLNGKLCLVGIKSKKYVKVSNGKIQVVSSELDRVISIIFLGILIILGLSIILINLHLAIQ